MPNEVSQGKVKSFVLDQDMFGHVVNLNFDKQGTEHKTFIGGFFSILIKVFLGIYIYLMFRKMYTHADDDCVTTSGALATEDLTLDMDDTNMMMFQVIRKQLPLGPNEPAFKLDQNLFDHIEIYYTQDVSNYNLP